MTDLTSADHELFLEVNGRKRTKRATYVMNCPGVCPSQSSGAPSQRSRSTGTQGKDVCSTICSAAGSQEPKGKMFVQPFGASIAP